LSDLFDFFRENESKLHEQPSDHVWKKLEARLERKRRRRRMGIRFLQLGSVIVILLLLFICAYLVWRSVQ
jgi:type VI protein secretion system component VasF